MLNHVAKATGIESDNRGFAQQRFDRDQPESFLSRRDYDGGGALVKLRQLRLRELSMPANARGDPELASQSLQRSATRAVADDVQ